MPLVRFQLRNEFRLGDPELHKAAGKDDSKAILDGVAVAGLVGILRQLGDLADFAAEIFNDLHEQVMATAARSHKMMMRVQHVETTLPPLETVVFAQTSHIHLTYTSGSDWHADIQTEQNHLSHSDLPHFVMDSYEECRDPPRFFLLDKFDAAGTGACLRRYSDPSFFKTVWARSELANAERLKRERKTNKSKKNVLHERNGEIQRAPTISQRLSRIQLASPDTSSQSLATENISVSGIRSKPELANQSTSFGLKSQLNFVENVFNGDSSTKHEDENDRLPSSKLNAFYNNNNPPVLLEGQNGEIADVDSSHKSLHGQSAPESSSITWDEKMEIVKPMRELFESTPQNQDQASETLPVMFQSKSEQPTASLPNIHQSSILSDVENIPKSYFGRNQSDEIFSETDNYMDALNTIETEVETDSECQTKREVELRCKFSHLEGESRTSGMQDIAAQISDSCNVGSPNSLQMTPSVNEVLIPPVQMTDTGYNQHTGVCRSPNLLVPGDNCFESDNGNPTNGVSTSASKESMIAVSSNKFQETQETSNVPPINFWTNGGLLGLEPSKPPDFASHNAASSIKNDRHDLTSHAAMARLHHEEFSGMSSTVEATEKSSSIGGERDGFPDVIRPDDLCILHTNQSFGPPATQANEHGLTDTIAATPRSEVQGISNIEVQSNEAVNEELSSMPSMKCLSLEVNGSTRNASVPSEPSAIIGIDRKKLSERPSLIERKKRQNGVAFQTTCESSPKGQPQLGSPKNPVSSNSHFFSHPSPPLELMKISFHPINGLDTSKLKLEFPNGHHSHKIIHDTESPSFHLLPKLAIPLQDAGSESDDETFYKSSPYPSDDILSPCSESNSEQWESAEMTGNRDHEIYDALRRVPSISSISSSSDIEGRTYPSVHPAHDGNLNAGNGSQAYDFCPAQNPSSMDATNYFENKEEGKSDSPKHILDLAVQYPNELPPPPPLPPLQWRMMRPTFSLAEDKQHNISERSNQTKDQQVPVPVASQQPMPLQPKPSHIEEAIASLNKDLKLNGHREVRKASNGKVLDEREDLLHQIRAKSFNLRPTKSTRPSFTPGPTTNVQVSAILEKANAIRQAFVGSDGEDNENWSDG